MELFLVRHALAEDPRSGLADADRALTRAGARKMRRGVRGLRALELQLARVLTSPWRRAQQTAAILAPIAAAPPIETELLCRSPRAELLALIAAQGGPTAAVGHAPWLGELAAWLAFGDTRHAEAIQLKKGGVAHLSGTAIPGGMILRALHPPRALRAAGGA